MAVLIRVDHVTGQLPTVSVMAAHLNTVPKNLTTGLTTLTGSWHKRQLKDKDDFWADSRNRYSFLYRLVMGAKDLATLKEGRVYEIESVRGEGFRYTQTNPERNYQLFWLYMISTVVFVPSLLTSAFDQRALFLKSTGVKIGITWYVDVPLRCWQKLFTERYQRKEINRKKNCFFLS